MNEHTELGIQVWFYITWAVFVAGVVGAGATLLFVLCSGALWLTFLRSWRSDPGVISASRQDKLRVSTGPVPAGPSVPSVPRLTLSCCRPSSSCRSRREAASSRRASARPA